MARGDDGLRSRTSPSDDNDEGETSPLVVSIPKHSVDVFTLAPWQKVAAFLFFLIVGCSTLPTYAPDWVVDCPPWSFMDLSTGSSCGASTEKDADGDETTSSKSEENSDDNDGQDGGSGNKETVAGELSNPDSSVREGGEQGGTENKDSEYGSKQLGTEEEGSGDGSTQAGTEKRGSGDGSKQAENKHSEDGANKQDDQSGKQQIRGAAPPEEAKGLAPVVDQSDQLTRKTNANGAGADTEQVSGGRTKDEAAPSGVPAKQQPAAAVASEWSASEKEALMAKGGRSALMSIRKKCKEDGVAPWTVVDRTGKRPSWYTPKEEGAGVEIVTDRGDGKKKALTKEGKKLCADGRDEAFFVRFFEQNDQVMDQANNVHRKSLKCLEAKGGSTKSVDLMVCPTFELLKTRQTEELDGIEPQRDWIRIKDDGEASCVGNQIQLSEEEITKKENMANQEDDYTKPCNSGWMTRHPGSECEFADKKSGEKWKGICLENWTRSKLELTSAEPSSTRERFWNGRGRTRYARCECGNLEQWREETKKMMGKAAATAEPGSGG